MITFGIIGAGWRTEFYLRIAQACPEQFEVAGVVARSPQRAERLQKLFGAATFTTVDDLLSASRPLFMVTSVSWASNPGVIQDLVSRGMPVLSETPPATTVAEMNEMCALVGKGAKIQVAEQYFLQPQHAARLAFAASGKLGEVTQAQVSACHGYHGVSLMRKFLGITYENARIQGMAFQSPIVAGGGRSGPPTEEKIVSSKQEIFCFDFNGKLGVFDFTGDQYFSYIRGQRLLVRGERGEIRNDTAVYLQDYLTPIQVEFTRHEAGANGNLEGQYLKGIQAGAFWWYRNPLAPARLADDEIAIGDCLLRMAEYAGGGAPFYPLAHACQDRYLDIMMHASLEGKAVQTETQTWAGD